MCQDFIKDQNLSPLPHHLPVDTNPPEPRPWTFSRPTGKDSVGNTTYSCSRIDYILLPTALVSTCKPSYTCDLGYLSDHVPLLAIVPTCILNLRIPHIVKAQAKKSCQTSHPYLPCQRFRPIKNTHALSDPSHGIIQELEETLLALTPAHTQALVFLNELQNKSARNTARLQHLSKKPAEEQVEILAVLVTDLIESVHKVALKPALAHPKVPPVTNNKKKNLLKLSGHSPQVTTIAHDQKRTKEICEAKNFTGSSKFKTSCPPLHKCPGHYQRNLTTKWRQPSAPEDNARYKAHRA